MSWHLCSGLLRTLVSLCVHIPEYSKHIFSVYQFRRILVYFPCVSILLVCRNAYTPNEYAAGKVPMHKIHDSFFRFHAQKHCATMFVYMSYLVAALLCMSKPRGSHCDRATFVIVLSSRGLWFSCTCLHVYMCTLSRLSLPCLCLYCILNTHSICAFYV